MEPEKMPTRLLAASFPVAKVNEHTIELGSLEPAEGISGPGQTPYIAQVVMPRFIWENQGAPAKIIVWLDFRDEKSLSKPPEGEMFMEPIYKEVQSAKETS